MRDFMGDLVLASVISATAMAQPGNESSMYLSVPITQPYVALTFDDGPTPDGTPRLLDILKANDVKATLFVIGERTANHAALVRRAAEEGHEIGNHTWKHPHLTKLSSVEALSEIQLATDAITQATAKKPLVFRPPYIDTNEELNRWIHDDLGMKVISTNVDSLDWRDQNATMAHESVLSKVAPGAIILCHENQPTTLDALDGIIKALKAKGYQFVTVSELIAMGNVAGEGK